MTDNNLKTMWTMSPVEQQQWLDEGNAFVLPFGQSRYVARKLDDGAYVAYHYDYATFGQLIQYSADYGPQWTLNPPGEPGPNLYEMSYQDIRAKLDEGCIFSIGISNHQGFYMRRTSDGAYIQYSAERDNFQSLQRRMAQMGPAWLWQASGPEGELPTHSE